MHARFIATIAAFVCGAAVLLRGQETPTFRSSVEAVQLSVIVTDADGNPVTGLTEADFEIIENRVTRPVTTFAAVDIPIERSEPTTLGERDVIANDGPPGRVYLIVLDQMTEEQALRTRTFLREFIEKYFGPNDTAAVVQTTRGVRDSGHEFTRNPRLLLNAIDNFWGGTQMGGWEREKNFTGDLRDLLKAVATTRAPRTAVIFVSCDIPVDPDRLVGYRPPKLGSVFAEQNKAFQEAMSFATRNSIAFYPVDPRGLQSYDLPQGLNWPGTFTFSMSTNSGGFTYTRGGGPPTAGNFSSPFTAAADARFNLRALAELTGGFALTGSNDFAGAFERLVRENSTYYVLGFNSNDDRRDGRYVSLEVRVKRPDLQVRSLSGYIASRGKPKERRMPKSVLAATWDAVATPMTTSGVPMRVFAAPFKSDKKDATVAVALEIAPDHLKLVEQDGVFKGQLEILFAVSDSMKRSFPIYRHRADVNLTPETYEHMSHTALRVVAQLPLPKGRYQLRASAGGDTTAGSVIYDLVVPDFSDKFSMSGVALTSEQAGDTYTVSPHKIDVEFPGPPTTVREFSRDDTLMVFTEAYENRKQPHNVTFTLELRDENGLAVDTLTSEQASDTKPTRASVYTFVPHLDLAEVPPGKYGLHVDVRSSLDGGRSLTRDIPIVVR